MIGGSRSEIHHSPDILFWKPRSEFEGGRFRTVSEPWSRISQITETPEKPAVQFIPLRGDFHDDPDMRPIVSMFLGELPKRILDFEAAIAASDLVVFRRLTHQMKGAAGGYGYPSITQAALTLERCIDMSGDAWAGACRLHLDALILLLRRAHAAIEHVSQ